MCQNIKNNCGCDSKRLVVNTFQDVVDNVATADKVIQRLDDVQVQSNQASKDVREFQEFIDGQGLDTRISTEVTEQIVEKVNDGIIQDEISSQVQAIQDEYAPELAARATIVEPYFKASEDTVQLGSELLTADGWGTNDWVGDFNIGFTHTVGNTSPLTYPIANTGTKYYYIKMKVTPTAVVDDGTSDFTVTIGGSSPFETYKGSYPSLVYTFGIQSTNDSGLVITPISNFSGTISELSVREITGTTIPTMKIQDSTGVSALEIRSSKGENSNVFIGKDSGSRNIDGYSNVGVGENALKNNTTGFWNTSIGSETMTSNTVGTRNVAVGRNALRANTVGDRNIGVGTYALYRNTTGRGNVSVGVDALWYNTTGNHNIGLGMNAINQNVSGSNNIGLGVDTLHSNTVGQSNIALGFNSLYKNTGNYNIGLGERALSGNTTGSYNIAFGRNTLSGTSTGDNNIALGFSSLRINTSGTHNISLGFNSMYTNSTGSNNVGLGNSSLHLNTTGYANVALGFESAYRNTVGYNNVSLGYQSLRANNEGDGNVAIGNGSASVGVEGSLIRNVLIGHNAGRVMTTGANYNVMLGASTGSTVTTGASNILIGFNVQTPNETTSNYLSIGNVIKGNTLTKRIGIDVEEPTAILHVKGGSSTIAGLKLDTSSALTTTASAGSFESFDGKLYFTNSLGERKEIAFV